jgi:hypothetical protein
MLLKSFQNREASNSKLQNAKTALLFSIRLTDTGYENYNSKNKVIC